MEQWCTSMKSNSQSLILGSETRMGRLRWSETGKAIGWRRNLGSYWRHCKESIYVQFVGATGSRPFGNYGISTTHVSSLINPANFPFLGHFGPKNMSDLPETKLTSVLYLGSHAAGTISHSLSKHTATPWELFLMTRPFPWIFEPSVLVKVDCRGK